MAEEIPFDLMVRFGPVPPRGAGHVDIESVRQALTRQRVYGAALASNRAILYDPVSGNTEGRRQLYVSRQHYLLLYWGRFLIRVSLSGHRQKLPKEPEFTMFYRQRKAIRCHMRRFGPY